MFFKNAQNLNFRRYWLMIEFILLCAVLPSVIIVYRLAPYMFGFLWGAAAYGLWIMYRQYREDRAAWIDIWGWRAVTWHNLRPILTRWVLCCIGMVAFTYVVAPDRLFALFLERPGMVLTLFVFYPIFSALPQEFIFCSFFFRRYAVFFPSVQAKVIASAITFAYAHILFINWIAPLLSLIAGFIFARTYAKTQSLALVTIEHGLYGNFLFFVGLGWYFFGGAVGMN